LIGVTFSGRTINNLRYADDIELIAQSPQALQTLLDKVETVSREYGLEMNTKKTKVMTITPQKEQITIICQGKELEQVETFKYLGAIITENGDCIKEIQARLGAARGAVRSLDCLWKDRSLHVKVKQRLLSSLVWTVALYGCETWETKGCGRKTNTRF